ncbi:MAG: HEPN domain-containing protein [Clostridiales bacterium]|jgi:HEPN domain-containing protein|nr:HEPN domain-containing protein [Clostridiales bacterium]
MPNKVEYWLDLCDYDLETAKAMQKTKRYLYVGFMCHQVAEKALKAVIAEKTEEMPPKIHDLNKLAKQGDILKDFSEQQLDLTETLTPLQIEARYPEYKDKIAQTLNKDNCLKLIKETEDFLCWIKKRLEKLPEDTPKK